MAVCFASRLPAAKEELHAELAKDAEKEVAKGAMDLGSSA